MQRIVFCGTSQSYHAANNSTGSLPAHSSLTISPCLSAIHTSSSKVLQCSDDTWYSAPTAESLRLCSEVWLCSLSYEWTSSSEANIPQHTLFLPQKCLGTLWCDKPARVCVHSARLILCVWAAGNLRIAAHAYFRGPFHMGSLSGLYYDIKHLVSVDTTAPMVYGSYTLEYNCHIPRPQTVVFLV